ncbi:MAG TPA: hypothetical protein VKQ08_11130 [Cyclobacteriaceae bacterium]|nr:hypothetical protein [Cyclobacteriaceae bacterium]
MIIGYNTQLGLRFHDPEKKVQFLKLMQDYLENELGITKSFLDKVNNIADKIENGEATLSFDTDEQAEEFKAELERIPHYGEDEGKKVRDKVTEVFGVDKEYNMVDDENSKYFFICDSVYKAAELIKVSSGFTGRTLKDINWGKYTYLMGKNRMVRFVVGNGAVRGFYFDDETPMAFEFCLEMEEGKYFCQKGYDKEFTQIMQILTFVELGDIEIKMLEAGRNNGASKKSGKVTNTSNNTVFVVDSTWNQIVIRTEGFAVRGHFRLQPCGPGMKDRSLIWIDAFEKHGYKRRPKGEIVK